MTVSMILVWTLCCLCLAWILGDFLQQAGRAVSPPDLSRILALPAWPSLKTGPADGWDILDRLAPQGKDQAEPEIPPAPMPEANVADPPENPLRLHGILLAGGGPLFCFFNTESGSWVRLRPDQEDPESGLRLDLGSDGEALLLSGQTGRQFSLNTSGIPGGAGKDKEIDEH